MHPDLGYAAAMNQQDELVDLASARRLARTADPGHPSIVDGARAWLGSLLLRAGAHMQHQPAPDDIAALRALRIAR